MARRLLGRTSVRDALDSAVIALEAASRADEDHSW